MSWTDFCEIFDEVEVCPMDECAKKARFAPLHVSNLVTISLQSPRARTQLSTTSSSCGVALWASTRVNSGRLTFDLIKSHEIHHFSTIKPSSVMLFLQASHLPPKLQLSRSAKKQSGSSFLGLWRSNFEFPKRLWWFWWFWWFLIKFDKFWYILDDFWWFWMIFGWFWWFGIVCNVWLRVYPYWLSIFSRQRCPTTRQKTRQTVGCPGNKMWESSGERIEMHWIYPLCCVVARWDCCDVERAWEIQSSFLIGVARHVVVMRIEPKDGYLLAKQRSGSQLSVLYRVHAVATIAAARLWP